jgi:hypothetical protein
MIPNQTSCEGIHLDRSYMRYLEKDVLLSSLVTVEKLEKARTHLISKKTEKCLFFSFILTIVLIISAI